MAALGRRLKNSKQTAQTGPRWPQCVLAQLCALQELPVLGETDLPGLLPQAWALHLRRVMDKWGSPVRGQESPSRGAQEVHSCEEPLLLANLPPRPGGEQDLEGPHCSERPPALTAPL